MLNQQSNNKYIHTLRVHTEHSAEGWYVNLCVCHFLLNRKSKTILTKHYVESGKGVEWTNQLFFISNSKTLIRFRFDDKWISMVDGNNWSGLMNINITALQNRFPSDNRQAQYTQCKWKRKRKKIQAKISLLQKPSTVVNRTGHMERCMVWFCLVWFGLVWFGVVCCSGIICKGPLFIVFVYRV